MRNKQLRLEFNELKSGGFKASKYIKTTLGMLTVEVFKGAQYTDNPDTFLVGIYSASKKNEDIWLNELTELDLKYLLYLLGKI